MDFLKYSAAGNDFIVIDDRTLLFPSGDSKYIKKLCHRRLGIGADGLLLLQTSQYADYKMRIFNSDGNEAGMCGNGLRCIGDFISSLENSSRIFEIEVSKKIYKTQKREEKIWVEFGKATINEWDVRIGHVEECLHFLNTGVPHAVIFVSELGGVDVQNRGAKVRHHPFFGKEGTNVNFVHVSKEEKIEVRTYERGVEGETLACGTGATAVAIIASQRLQLTNPIKIHVQSGSILEFYVQPLNETEMNVQMTGPAELIFHGAFNM